MDFVVGDRVGERTEVIRDLVNVDELYNTIKETRIISTRGALTSEEIPPSNQNKCRHKDLSRELGICTFYLRPIYLLTLLCTIFRIPY